MFYWKIFYNKELAEMVYEYLKNIFKWRETQVWLDHRNWQYVVGIQNPDLEYLTDVQKEMVKFFIPHLLW